MPWSAQIFVGVPFKDISDATKFFKKNNILVEKDEASDKGELTVWQRLRNNIDYFTIEITIQERVYELIFNLHFGGDEDFKCPSDKSISGKKIAYSVLYGAELTGRYGSAVLDTDWEDGRSDPFILDLEMLIEIRTQVAKFLPKAEILLMDLFY